MLEVMEISEIRRWVMGYGEKKKKIKKGVQIVKQMHPSVYEQGVNSDLNFRI